MRGKRVCVVALAGILIGLPVIYLYQTGPGGPWFPGCLFHELTGFHCPGCGLTRATYSALHGDLLAALRFNCLGLLLMSGALLGLGLEVFGWMRDKPPPVSLRFGRRVMWWLIGAVLAFWVLRNIPAWPFSLLAPP